MPWLANGGNTYAALTTRFFLDINTLYKPAFLFLFLFGQGRSYTLIKQGRLDRGNRVPTWIYKDARTWTVRLRYIQLPRNERGLFNHA